MENTLAEALWVAHSLFERGKTSGSSANLSFRVDDRVYITASGSCFGTLKEGDFSQVSLNGSLLAGEKPSKELPLHLHFYRNKPGIQAVIHTHGPYAALWSCRLAFRHPVTGRAVDVFCPPPRTYPWDLFPAVEG